jgi:hypothetical protein
MRESMKMKPKGLLRIGTRVRVRKFHRKTHLRGLIGTIERRYGGDVYVAFEVLFSNGHSELFWHNELEEAHLWW